MFQGLHIHRSQSTQDISRTLHSRSSMFPKPVYSEVWIFPRKKHSLDRTSQVFNVPKAFIFPGLYIPQRDTLLAPYIHNLYVHNTRPVYSQGVHTTRTLYSQVGTISRFILSQVIIFPRDAHNLKPHNSNPLCSQRIHTSSFSGVYLFSSDTHLWDSRVPAAADLYLPKGTHSQDSIFPKASHFQDPIFIVQGPYISRALNCLDR